MRTSFILLKQIITKVKFIEKKIRVRGANKSSMTSASVYNTSSVLAFKATVTQPIETKMRPRKTYFQINYSPRISLDQKMTAMIALA